MRVALIHDHLAQDGGAERVLRVLAEMFPEAPIFTLLYEPKQVAKYFKNRNIMTSIIQRIPGGIRFYKFFMPIMPMAVEFFNLRDYDLVISDTSSFAKGVITGDNTLHICYCHTPTRYLWSDTHSYIEELKINKYLKKIVGLSLNKIRVWDKNAAERVDYFIANSKFIAHRIKKYYRRQSEVIYPPVEIEMFSVNKNKQDFYLAGGRLVPYKRFDLLVNTFKANGKKLKIFGDGPDETRLRSLANGTSNIEFLGRITDKEKAELYGQAKAFLNPQEEDFGITMVEALASGTPVIAFASGGACEIVTPETGLLFAFQNIENLSSALLDFENKNWNYEACRAQAEKFSITIFKDKMTDFIERKIAEFKTE